MGSLACSSSSSWSSSFSGSSDPAARGGRYARRLRRAALPSTGPPAWQKGWRRREQPVGGMSGGDDDAAEPVDIDSDVADVVARRVEHAAVEEVLGRLHWRERRELRLFAYGLSHHEIAEFTGTSYPAVNRWMARGRNALRAAAARRHPSDDDCDGPSPAR